MIKLPHRQRKILFVVHTLESGASASFVNVKDRPDCSMALLTRPREGYIKFIVRCIHLAWKQLFVDVVIINGLAVISNPYMSLIKHLVGQKRLFLYWHEGCWQWNETVSRYKISTKRAAEISILVRESNILADSKFVADWLIKQFQPHFSPEVVYENFNRRIDAIKSPQAEDQLHVLAVGTLCKRKGFDIFLSVFKVIQRHATFTWIGSSSELSEFSSEIEQANSLSSKKKLRIMGFKHNPFDLLEANIFLLPSRSEPFGISYLEALAAGLFVIASPESGFSEVSSDSGCSWVCNDVEEIVAFLEKINLTDLYTEEVDDVRRRTFLNEFKPVSWWLRLNHSIDLLISQRNS